MISFGAPDLNLIKPLNLIAKSFELDTLARTVGGLELIINKLNIF